MRALVSEALKAAHFEVRSCASSAEAIACFDGFDPDVLVTDIDLGARPNGAELAVILNLRAPHCAIVFLTNYPNAAALPAVPTGSTFVNKASVDSVDGLIEAVNATLADASLNIASGSQPAQDVVGALTRVQLDTLRLIAQGCSNAEIAKQRGSSMRAVEKAVARTFEALGLNSSPSLNPRVAAATLYARTFGLPAHPQHLPPGDR